MKQLKWVLGLSLFGCIVGTLIGVLEVFFGKVLLIVTEIRLAHFSSLIWLLPITGLFIGWLYQTYGAESKQGMGLLFDVGHGQRKAIPLRLIPLVTVSTWLTHLVGGSAGREGVAVQIGGTFANWFSHFSMFRFLRKDSEWRRLVLITGMAAGFSGLFQVPLAAVCFAIEVLVAGKFMVDALIPATFASLSAYGVSRILGLEGFKRGLLLPKYLDWHMLLGILILGIIFGLVGRLFRIGLSSFKKWVHSHVSNTIFRLLLMSALLAVILWSSHSGRYSGLGTQLITASFDGGTVYLYDFIMKLILTVFTLGLGFQGGEVTPLFSIGASLGVWVGPLVGVPAEMSAALGYMAVFGSATNTLLAPIMIAGEIFGFGLVPYAIVVMSLAYVSNGNQSIYSKQKSVKQLRITYKH